MKIGTKLDCVYDLETESHDFNCGFPLVVRYTDSFVLSVNTDDIVKHLDNLRELIDFSNLNREHRFFSEVKKRLMVILKLKPLRTLG